MSSRPNEEGKAINNNCINTTVAMNVVIIDNEPSNFRKDKNIEYTLFLMVASLGIIIRDPEIGSRTRFPCGAPIIPIKLLVIANTQYAMKRPNGKGRIYE